MYNPPISNKERIENMKNFLKKYKGNIMRFSMVVILLQFFSLFMPFVIYEDVLKFTWFGMSPDVSFWVFFLVSTICFGLLSYYIGEHDK